MISYFLSNISAENYRNRIVIVYVKIIASRKWDVFETRCIKRLAGRRRNEPRVIDDLLFFVRRRDFGITMTMEPRCQHAAHCVEHSLSPVAKAPAFLSKADRKCPGPVSD